ncbi:hypothetical protein C8J57DRAFT_1733350 [Mycena rebaudengoi]|nr:hypothetical protein C8J57DRAFT_1733350 [Mycena rebaudengoi]
MGPTVSRNSSRRCRPSATLPHLRNIFSDTSVFQRHLLFEELDLLGAADQLRRHLTHYRSSAVSARDLSAGIHKISCREERRVNLMRVADVPHEGQAGPYARKGLLMFVCSNMQVIEQLAFNVLQLLTLGANLPDIERKLIDIHLSLNAFGRVNCLMNDATVCCRAWVLYHDNLKVRLLLILCPLDSLAGATTHMTFGRREIRPLRLARVHHGPSPLRHQHRRHLPHGLQNVQIRVHLDLPKNKQTKVKRIPVILTGYILSHLGMLSFIPFLYTILTNQGGDTTGYKIVANIIPQLSAIYCVIIHQHRLGPDPLRREHHWDRHGDDGNAPHGVPIRLADTSRSSDVDSVVAEKEKADGAAKRTVPFRG